jgi:hypothetical protein
MNLQPIAGGIALAQGNIEFAGNARPDCSNPGAQGALK